MNAVEIELAVSKLVEAPYDAAEFPYAFLEAFGNNATTVKRLRTAGKSSTNKSDVAIDGVTNVLQRNNIHIAACAGGGPDVVADLLAKLSASVATAKYKAKFILATDGETVQAERLNSEEPPLICTFPELDDRFGYFLELAGISTVRQIRENAFDVKATGRLNRLYVELLKNNPDWDGEARREDLNHFFARLIFCFFAEDTKIFLGADLFTETVRQMSEPSGANVHEVLGEIFRAMDVPPAKRATENLRPWAARFPYVNGGLFGGATGADVPKFTQIARSYLLHVGSLDWTKINPDIFGSMIQAVADDEERGALGMHYTSVPNILKVLNPLFLDDLREQLAEAGDNARKLLNLRKRLSRIRVFDPACGSGNFLVIAYKQMREIEAEINRRRGEAHRATEIPTRNFRGIELRHFAAEVARLALIIAEYQSDALYRGPTLALVEFLPLESENWITRGNALCVDWRSICDPDRLASRIVSDDLFQTPLEQPQIDFENTGGETYICGNPPYLGSTFQTATQKADLHAALAQCGNNAKSLDYVAGWFAKAAEYATIANVSVAFVATNSICQGQQVAMLWPMIRRLGLEIAFAHTSFRWSNLASRNAGVTVVIIGLSRNVAGPKRLYTADESGTSARQLVDRINSYLAPAAEVIVAKRTQPLGHASKIEAGGKPVDGGNLLLSSAERRRLVDEHPVAAPYTMRVYGANEYTKGIIRYCLWLTDSDFAHVRQIAPINDRIRRVVEMRLSSNKMATKQAAKRPHRFDEVKQTGAERVVIVPTLTAENRRYIPAGLLNTKSILTNLAFASYDADLFVLALLNSSMHFAWVATVCGKFKTDYRFSNVLGWNTFPLPDLTDTNKADLTRCAEDILLAREAHWPATIAELYDPENMPADLRAAHDRNDETLERIYVGRRFKNDTERLEVLFRMYVQMTEGKSAKGKGGR